MDCFPFRVIVPLVHFLPQTFTTPFFQTLLDGVIAVVEIVVVTHPHQRVGLVHKRFHEFHGQSFLFFHIPLPVYGRIPFPVHVFIFLLFLVQFIFVSFPLSFAARIPKGRSSILWLKHSVEL